MYMPTISVLLFILGLHNIHCLSIQHDIEVESDDEKILDPLLEEELLISNGDNDVQQDLISSSLERNEETEDGTRMTSINGGELVMATTGPSKNMSGSQDVQTDANENQKRLDNDWELHDEDITPENIIEVLQHLNIKIRVLENQQLKQTRSIEALTKSTKPRDVWVHYTNSQTKSEGKQKTVRKPLQLRNKNKKGRRLSSHIKSYIDTHSKDHKKNLNVLKKQMGKVTKRINVLERKTKETKTKSNQRNENKKFQSKKRG